MNRRPHSLGTVGSVLLYALTLGTMCLCQDVGNGQDHPKSLVVLPFASKVSFTSTDGKTQLIYTLHAAYPAKDVLKMISERLRRQGWKPLKQDMLNPSMPSSHVRGWEQFEDDTTKPRTMVKQWLAQWANPHRDVVWYELQYRYPLDGRPDLDELRVLAIFIPANAATKMREGISS